MLSQKNIVTDINSGCRNFYLGGNTVAILPFHHTFGLITAVFMVFNYGQQIYINKSLKRVQKDMPVSYTHLDVYKRQGIKN